MSVDKDLPPDDVAALDPVNDDAVPPVTADEPAPKPEAAADDDGDEVIERVPNPREAQLKRIADRLKQQRAAENGPEFTGDFSDPAQTVGNVGRPPPETEPKAPETGPPAAPKRIKLKVDHEEFERDIAQVAELADMTVEEVEAQPERAKRYAQRELAAQRRLDQAREILRGAQQRTPQPSAPNQGQTDPDFVPEPSADAPNQGADLKQLVEDLQFGADPADIATRLDNLLTKKASDIASTATLRQKMSDDVSLTMQAYEKIKADNAELFSDPVNEAAMQRMLLDGYRDDLRAIGVPEDRIPRDMNQLADWHRLYRVQGHKVRAPDKLLGDVRDKFVQWRGIAPNQNQPAPRPGAPRVNLDRTDRRQAIPSQPPRAGAPMPLPAAAPQRTSRQAAIEKMRRARGQATAA